MIPCYPTLGEWVCWVVASFLAAPFWVLWSDISLNISLGRWVWVCWVVASFLLLGPLPAPPSLPQIVSSSRARAGDQLPEPWRRRRPEATVKTTSSRRHSSIRGGQVQPLSTSLVFRRSSSITFLSKSLSHCPPQTRLSRLKNQTWWR